jgi:hypothetical protein
MTTSSTHTLDLAEQAGPPADGVLSRTVFQDDRPKALVFDLAQGQEPSEHTAAKPAVLLFRRGGEGRRLERRHTAGPGRNLGPHAGGPEALDQGEDAGGDAPGVADVTQKNAKPSDHDLPCFKSRHVGIGILM